MTLLEKIDLKVWEGKIAKEIQQKALYSLERGKVLYMPNLSFSVLPDEECFLSPDKVDPKRKNISYDLKKDRLGGSLWAGDNELKIKEMLKRYALASQNFLQELLPHYTPFLMASKTSLRPTEITGRKSSLRKDDTRLHVDAFPSNPTNGYRLMRMFTNINREGKPRVWRVGEPFENVVKKFACKTSMPLPGSAFLLKLLKITKNKRSAYDHYMLHIHNQMKEDGGYQERVTQEEIHFPAGSSWIVFTDQVSHAAMSGKDVLEQTFFLPLAGLKNASTSPLRVLEKHLKKPLLQTA